MIAVRLAMERMVTRRLDDVGFDSLDRPTLIAAVVFMRAKSRAA
jgi:hypothetical protein